MLPSIGVPSFIDIPKRFRYVRILVRAEHTGTGMRVHVQHNHPWSLRGYTDTLLPRRSRAWRTVTAWKYTGWGERVSAGRRSCYGQERKGSSDGCDPVTFVGSGKTNEIHKFESILTSPRESVYVCILWPCSWVPSNLTVLISVMSSTGWRKRFAFVGGAANDTKNAHLAFS